MKEFRDEVKQYLKDSGRKQGWLRDKMAERGVSLVQSSLSERMTGALSFSNNEVAVIQAIMRKHKV